MKCPITHGHTTHLVWDSADPPNRCPSHDQIAPTPEPYTGPLPYRPLPIGLPVTSRPVAHYMLAYDDVERSYYIYVKCVWAADLVMICRAMVSTRMVSHIELYESIRDGRRGYIDTCYTIVFEHPYPALTLADELTNMMQMFRSLVIARGYVPRLYYDDTDVGMPVTRFTPWRPKIPKGSRGWYAMLNLKDQTYKEE